MRKKTTPTDIAAWMLAEVERDLLYQDIAAAGIEEYFGEEFVYANENGNPAIRKDVLAAFKNLSGDRVVWERGDRLWRLREGLDEPGRQQY